jgi:hypothetical protein
MLTFNSFFTKTHVCTSTQLCTSLNCNIGIRTPSTFKTVCFFILIGFEGGFDLRDTIGPHVSCHVIFKITLKIGLGGKTNGFKS